jgi:hypothetical protein
MNWNKFFATVVLLSGPCCFAQAPMAETENPAKRNPLFSIAVTPPDDPIKLGSPIPVTVTVTNISGKDAAWPSERGLNTPYKVCRYLLMKDGHEVEMTVFHRKITGRQRPDDPQEVETGSTISLPVPPGVIFKFTIDMKRLYEIRGPGMYTLEASLFDESSKTIVHSKNLSLAIASQ